KNEYGSAVVRIGVTGEGLAPHYRVEPEGGEGAAILRGILSNNTQEEIDKDLANRLEVFSHAYSGRSHKRLPLEHRELKHVSWSNHSMKIDEVRTLIGELRGHKVGPKE